MTAIPSMPERTGVCPACGKRRKLTKDGKLPSHGYAIPVSARAVRVVGQGQVVRPCPGEDPKPGTVQEAGSKND